MAVQVELGHDLEEVVNHFVTIGRFASATEVLREGIRLIRERETRLSEVDAAIARGIEDLDAGRLVDAADAFDRLERKYENAALAKGA